MSGVAPAVIERIVVHRVVSSARCR